MIFGCSPCVSVWYKRHFNEARHGGGGGGGDPNASRIIARDYSRHWRIASSRPNYATYIFYFHLGYTILYIFPSCSPDRTYIRGWKIKTVSFRHEFPQTSATIPTPCLTPPPPRLSIRIFTIASRGFPIFDEIFVTSAFSPCDVGLFPSTAYVHFRHRKHVMLRSPLLVHINKDTLRKHARVCAKKRGGGERRRIGTEKIKKGGMQGNFRMPRTVSFCMPERDRVVNDCHFLSGSIVVVHGKLLINLDSIILTSQVIRTRTWAPFLRNDIKSCDHMFLMSLYVIIFFFYTYSSFLYINNVLFICNTVILYMIKIFLYCISYTAMLQSYIYHVYMLSSSFFIRNKL